MCVQRCMQRNLTLSATTMVHSQFSSSRSHFSELRIWLKSARWAGLIVEVQATVPVDQLGNKPPDALGGHSDLPKNNAPHPVAHPRPPPHVYTRPADISSKVSLAKQGRSHMTPGTLKSALGS